jgi:hypothetical protein
MFSRPFCILLEDIRYEVYDRSCMPKQLSDIRCLHPKTTMLPFLNILTAVFFCRIMRSSILYYKEKCYEAETDE